MGNVLILRTKIDTIRKACTLVVASNNVDVSLRLYHLK